MSDYRHDCFYRQLFDRFVFAGALNFKKGKNSLPETEILEVLFSALRTWNSKLSSTRNYWRQWEAFNILREMAMRELLHLDVVCQIGGASLKMKSWKPLNGEAGSFSPSDSSLTQFSGDIFLILEETEITLVAVKQIGETSRTICALPAGRGNSVLLVFDLLGKGEDARACVGSPFLLRLKTIILL